MCNRVHLHLHIHEFIISSIHRVRSAATARAHAKTQLRCPSSCHLLPHRPRRAPQRQSARPPLPASRAPGAVWLSQAHPRRRRCRALSACSIWRSSRSLCRSGSRALSLTCAHRSPPRTLRPHLRTARSRPRRPRARSSTSPCPCHATRTCSRNNPARRMLLNLRSLFYYVAFMKINIRKVKSWKW